MLSRVVSSLLVIPNKGNAIQHEIHINVSQYKHGVFTLSIRILEKAIAAMAKKDEVSRFRLRKVE